MLSKMRYYACLLRLHKPIGILLLLWPTCWGLWIAGQGHPNKEIVIIFLLGVVTMRSAGCVINDIADRHFDRHVARTQNRPLTSGRIKLFEALILFFLLILSAFILVLCLNRFTALLAFIGAVLAIIYPFLKRITHLPQVGLGLAFSWGIIMAFAAITNQLSWGAWELFLTAALWSIIYDTMYAMVDHDDDVKIGIKSTAILFGNNARFILTSLQVLFVLLLIHIGSLFHLTKSYFFALAIISLFFLYQNILLKQNAREKYFSAFLNNQWVGMIIFLGIVMSYL